MPERNTKDYNDALQVAASAGIAPAAATAGTTAVHGTIVTQRTLLVKTAIALIVGAILVVVCYFIVDRPVAWFVHNHRMYPREFWHWPPLLSRCLKDAALLSIIPLILWWACKPGGRLQTVLLASTAAWIVAAVLKQLSKCVAGRYWPETWQQHNPSLIGSGAYGFNPFHFGAAFESFPSGHAAVVCAVAVVLWVGYPRGRWLYGMIVAGVCVALVDMNYHFVSDVIAGAILGSITGIYVTRLFRLHGPEPLP